MTAIPAPPRFAHRPLGEYLALVLVLALVVTSIANTAPPLDTLQRGVARLFAPSGFLVQMFPPDLSRVDRIAWKLLETLQMAVAGAALGLVFAVPFAVLATDRLSPHPVVKVVARGLIAFFRLLQAMPGSESPSALAWVSSHPQHGERIAALEALIPTLARAPAFAPAIDWAAVQAEVGPPKP